MALDVTQLYDPQRALLDPRAYQDESVYELELERIFQRGWLFLAHDSMLPNTGDFVQTYMAEDAVLVVRQADGSVKAFLNQCRHRGMRICRADLGNARAFTCTYHGWAYDIGGNLVNVPHEEDGYRNELDKDAWGPVQVPRIDSHCGLIFASWDPEAPTLLEYLGDYRWYLDAMFDRYEGGQEVIPGAHKWIIDCNWKFAAEQFASDAYHAEVSHGSATIVMQKQTQQTPEQVLASRKTGRQFSSTKGHGIGFQSTMRPDGAGPVADAWTRSMEPHMIERLGEHRLPIKGHNTVFPNFSFLGNGTIRVWHPRGPGQIEVWAWMTVPRIAPPEVKEAYRLNTLRTFSPGGLFEQDDGENWNEIQKVMRGRVSRKVLLNVQMGMGYVQRDPNYPGRTIDYGFAEEAARGLWTRWQEMLSSTSWSEIDAKEQARIAALEHEVVKSRDTVLS